MRFALETAVRRLDAVRKPGGPKFTVECVTVVGAKGSHAKTKAHY